MRITVRFTGIELTGEFQGEPTLGFVLADPHVKAQLGYGTDVEGHIGGVPQPNELQLRDGMVVSVHDRKCEKSGVVLRVGPYSFYFYQGEVLLGEPAHIHVEHAGRIAKFWLEPTIDL